MTALPEHPVGARPRVGVVGVGYVGLTTAVCLAGRGADTVAVDVDPDKVAQLAAGEPGLAEPGMAELLNNVLAKRSLRVTADYAHLADRDVVFVCVPTPSAPDGGADLRALDGAVDELAEVLPRRAVIVLKSTVPVGTTRLMAKRLRGRGVGVVSSPEFLREGHAVDDFHHPDRVVVGALAEADADLVCTAYGADLAPVMRMSPESAEMAKYASNAFLAVKLSYANSLAQLCHRTGADMGDVTACMGADDRIGPAFLQPGPGWGGSCLPKDTAALLHIARGCAVDLNEVAAARATNAAQPQRITTALRRALGGSVRDTRITAFGLTFKAATSDIRDSPALAVCAELAAEGAQVCGYDPELANIDPEALHEAGVTAVDDPYRAAKSAAAIVVLTEWRQFGELDWAAIAEQSAGAVVADTRNALDPATIAQTGLRYLRNGASGGF